MATQALSVGADRWTLTFVGHYDYQNRSHFDGAGDDRLSDLLQPGLVDETAKEICAYGANQSEELNPVYVRRALVLLCICCLSCLAKKNIGDGGFVFAFTSAVLCEPLLLALGQPADVAYTSAHYAQVQLLGVPFYWLANAATVALNSAKYTMPSLIMNLISSPMQVLLCFVFMHPRLLNLGYAGNALARSVGGVISCMVLLSVIRYRGLQCYVWRCQPNSEPVMKAHAFRSYLAVSVPAALVVWSEWWAFEVLSLLVGRTPNAEMNLAAHGTMFNIIVVFYMSWTSTCIAVCTLVGNALGAEENSRIRPLLYTSGLFSLATSLLVALGYELLKSSFARLFTEEGYAQLMTFYGALRGANFQRPGILGTLIGYWVVGLPLGALLGCYWHWPTPLLGVWFGNATALAIAATWVLSAVPGSPEGLKLIGRRVLSDMLAPPFALWVGLPLSQV
ncbi:unnamed protein product [Durusdinium trenchii]|uniref:Uncharacterized protein n=1 Tax=Durusdinium trenchii TaxID=1381693 RepID=A0ABP0RBZ8_9DINO